MPRNSIMAAHLLLAGPVIIFYWQARNLLNNADTLKGAKGTDKKISFFSAKGGIV